MTERLLNRFDRHHSPEKSTQGARAAPAGTAVRGHVPGVRRRSRSRADIAKIARTHIDRITGILENKRNVREREAFERFAEELRDDLNDSITREEIIEMLAQHLVTKPVFDALFSGNSFAAENPMSCAMQAVLDALHEHHLEKEASTLAAFYESVKMRASGIERPPALSTHPASAGGDLAGQASRGLRR